MAATSSQRLSRSRRRSKKTIQYTDILVVSAFFAGAILLLGSRMSNDGGAEYTRKLTTQTAQQRRCQDSCSAVIAAAMEATSKTAASHAELAASAVNALLHGHNRSSVERTSTSVLGEVPKSHSVYSILAPSPQLRRTVERLPPLLEKLIGSLEQPTTMREKYYKEQRQRQRQLTTKHNPNIDSRTRETRYEDKPHILQKAMEHEETEDSVAAVAAAAAAAIFSQRDSKRGYGLLRMKTYNDQWEAALRWVASWDDDTLYNKTHGDTIWKKTFSSSSHSSSSSLLSSSSSSSSSRRKKRIKPSSSILATDRQYPKTNSDSGNQKNLDSLFETCVRKCRRTGNLPNLSSSSSSFSSSSSSTATITSTAATHRDFYTTVEGKIKEPHRLSRQFLFLNHTYTLILRQLQSIPNHDLSTILQRPSKLVIGIIISSTFLWSIFHAGLMRKKTNTVLPQIEESSWNLTFMDKGENDTAGSTRTKKTFNKKAKRKKTIAKDPRIKVAHSTHGFSKPLEEEDTLDSDDSYDLRQLRDTRTQMKVLSTIAVDDTSSIGPSHARNSQSGSTSSYSTDDTDSQIVPLTVTQKSKEIYDTHPPMEKEVIQSVKSFVECIPTSNRHYSSVALIDGSPTDPENQSSAVLADTVDNVHRSCVTKVKVDISEQVIIQQPLLPTDEQREEAARKLREFQQMQIKKIIEQREARKLQEQQTKQTSIRSTPQHIHHSQMVEHTPNTVMRTDESVRASFNPTCSYQSLRDTIKTSSDRIRISSSNNLTIEEVDRENLLDEISRESFLLKSMMDEDDETVLKHDGLLFPSMNQTNPQQMHASKCQDSSSSVATSSISFSASWVHGDNTDRRIW